MTVPAIEVDALPPPTFVETVDAQAFVQGQPEDGPVFTRTLDPDVQPQDYTLVYEDEPREYWDLIEAHWLRYRRQPFSWLIPGGGGAREMVMHTEQPRGNRVTATSCSARIVLRRATVY